MSVYVNKADSGSEDGSWITIGGAHIFVKSGESAGDAFARTTGKKLGGKGKGADGSKGAKRERSAKEIAAKSKGKNVDEVRGPRKNQDGVRLYSPSEIAADKDSKDRYSYLSEMVRDLGKAKPGSNKARLLERDIDKHMKMKARMDRISNRKTTKAQDRADYKKFTDPNYGVVKRQEFGKSKEPDRSGLPAREKRALIKKAEAAYVKQAWVASRMKDKYHLNPSPALKARLDAAHKETRRLLDRSDKIEQSTWPNQGKGYDPNK